MPMPSPCFIHSHLGVATALQPVVDQDDEYCSITRHLVETAVTVREMSKQLGRARIHSNIKTVLIVTKARDNRLIKLTRKLALHLMLRPRNNHKRGLIVYVDAQLRHSRRFDAAGIQRDHPELFAPVLHFRNSSSSSSPSSISSSDSSDNQDGLLRYWTNTMCSQSPHLFDFVITLGGDGTVLFTSWLFQRIVPPVLSFALGSLGFLTIFDFTDYQSVVDAAVDTGIHVNLRMRFTCTVYRSIANEIGKKRRAVKKADTGEILMKNVEKDGWEALECDSTCSYLSASAKDKEIMCYSTRPVESFEVLNDLVIDRGPSPYVSLLELFGDEHHMTTVQGDGLTIATPTGSTAYSLSAGGSLVHPEIPAILITPICPHTLSFRPMLLPDTMEVRVCVPYNSRSTAWASFDGRGRVELRQGDHIKIAASRYPFPTVCADKQSTDWFHAITRTLKWNERERQKSFVVVEEENPAIQRRRDNVPISHQAGKSSSKSMQEEEEEASEEEETGFDIDDSSTNTQENVIAGVQTPHDSGLGHEKAMEQVMLSRVEKLTNLRVRQAGRSRSRSRASRRRSYSPTSSSEQSGVETPGRYAGPHHHPPPSFHSHHVNFELPEIPHIRHELTNGTEKDEQQLKLKDHETEHDNARTPTVMNQIYNSRPPRQSRGLRSSDHHGTRAFAVWGQDESDSAASDEGGA
ncbi:hypothetical protein APHAL10511_000099 [Amanita phalloides]|nr:hypothetical protein APHAL10511_000099 [Amanita phalloides]